MAQLVPKPRLAALSPTGRFAVIRQKSGLQLVDALGASPRMTIALEDVDDFACVGSELWVASAGVLRRFSPGTGKELGSGLEFERGGRLFAVQSPQSKTSLWRNEARTHAQLLTLVDEHIQLRPVELDPQCYATVIGGGRVLIAQDGVVQLQDVRGTVVSTIRLPNAGPVVSGGPVLGGRAVAVMVSASSSESALIVFRPGGGLVHNVPLPAAQHCAIADNRGIAIVAAAEASSGSGDPPELLALDLRFGKLLGTTPAPLPVAELAVDANGKYVAIAGFSAKAGDANGEDAEKLSVAHQSYADLFGVGLSRAKASRSLPPSKQHASPETATDAAEAPPPDEANVQDTRRQSAVDETDEAGREPEGPIEVPTGFLAALGRRAPRSATITTPQSLPYRNAAEHLDDLLDSVTAQTSRAIADAWDSGRLSLPSNDDRPFQNEVRALTGDRLHLAADTVAAAKERVTTLAAVIAARQAASTAAEKKLPFVEITNEFALSPLARMVLFLVAAPSLRESIARLFGILANDEGRAICDRSLVQQILAGDDKQLQHQVVSELAREAPLVRHGLIRIGATSSDFFLFAPLSVDPILLARLRGDAYEGATAGAATTVLHSTERRLEALALDDKLKRKMVLALIKAPPEEKPIRLVLRGRRGSGRRTLLAALAVRAGRALAVINTERLPRATGRFSTALRNELLRAGLRGAVPCVSGLHVLDSSDGEAMEQVRSVLRGYSGPLLFRASPEDKPPIDPGFLDFTIPPLSETKRAKFWETALERAGLSASKTDELATRFRIGPGTIETVIATTLERREAVRDNTELSEDASDELDRTARQHIASRLGSVANRVDRLARWDQVALPEDVIDSIREFLGRVGHRRKVYEEWGYDARMTSSRGLTALFHGPPGTGKSMVAGLIARELSLDLYRVDLAQITSKWIGETEKNLGEVFDAAEDGQSVILFDEADSLFAKRTEVKSSVDRYANLEVNYLLQRLDTFDGVAILTTNLEGSLDNAFKRRLSLRLAFPFPDEELRVRLWLAHIPPKVPTAGDFDFESLAKKFPMSGGYIRNSALRAAFLAAQENVPLAHEHIERAIKLEYREMGKLTPGGRME